MIVLLEIATLPLVVHNDIRKTGMTPVKQGFTGQSEMYGE